ncbi:MAG: YtxH domain-containing protein [Anaerolineae bacterium]|nr:YtxH domain-containing protein [Anaerolineae bacterium]MDW8297874.1 YtxH domain-containing protein [Anaerolineae bacterium]
MAERGEGRSFIIGALIGAVIGALWALWNAPRSGKETRQAIQQALDERVNSVRRQMTGESLEDALAEGKATARRLNQR